MHAGFQLAGIWSIIYVWKMPFKFNSNFYLLYFS